MQNTSLSLFEKNQNLWSMDETSLVLVSKYQISMLHCRHWSGQCRQCNIVTFFLHLCETAPELGALSKNISWELQSGPTLVRSTFLTKWRPDCVVSATHWAFSGRIHLIARCDVFSAGLYSRSALGCLFKRFCSYGFIHVVWPNYVPLIQMRS